MADLFAGPNVPLTKAFLFCGWRCLPVDWALDPSHDLSDPTRQRVMHEQLTDVDFIAAAFDCSTKSRAREIPRKFEDGRPAPQPLRSESFPDGLPNLSARDQLRVEKDNAASSFILHEIDRLERSGGAAVRENPYRSLHWHVQQEVDMWATGRWKDKRYASCVFAGARCKQQRLRHNLDEIDSWPIPACHHTHAANEWKPQRGAGVSIGRGGRIYGTAVLCDCGRSIVVGMSYGEGDSPGASGPSRGMLAAGSTGWIWTPGLCVPGRWPPWPLL